MAARFLYSKKSFCYINTKKIKNAPGNSHFYTQMCKGYNFCLPK